MAPTTTDIVVFAIWLSWTCLSPTPTAMKNGAFALILPTQQVLEQLVLDSHFTFAPGPLDAVHSKTPPTISYFKSLPLHLVKLWAVYLLVLEKAGHRPKIYIGSATHSKRDVSMPMGQYRREQCIPGFVQRYLNNGYRISHKGLLCWSPFPTAAEKYRFRGLFLVLETAFSLYFWAMVSRNKDYGMPHLCPWSLDNMEYYGCCGHLSVNEYIHGSHSNLTTEQIEVLDAETQLKHSRRDRAKRGKEDKARGEVLRIKNNRASEKYRCDLCDVVFGTGAGLRRHNRTQKHIDNVGGITKTLKDPGNKHRRQNLEARIYFCKPCDYAAECQKISIDISSRQSISRRWRPSRAKSSTRHQHLQTFLDFLGLYSSSFYLNSNTAIQHLLILKSESKEEV
jgi:hypothetical protein